MSIISFNGIDYGCSGSPKIEQITEANYQALVQAGEVDPSIAYFRIDAPSLYPLIQDDATATDLENGKLATGQTIESWANKKYVTQETLSLANNACVLTKTGKSVVCQFTGLDAYTYRAGINATLIPNEYVRFRPSAGICGFSFIYNGDNNIYMCTLDIGTNGALSVNYIKTVNSSNGLMSRAAPGNSGHKVWGTMCWTTI